MNDQPITQELLDTVVPIERDRPFWLFYNRPGDLPTRMHWNDDEQRWLLCEQQDCRLLHAWRIARGLRYADQPADAPTVTVLVGRQLNQLEFALTPSHYRDAYIKTGTGLATSYSTVEVLPS